MLMRERGREKREHIGRKREEIWIRGVNQVNRKEYWKGQIAISTSSGFELRICM
jgi:hypothetical protein